MLFAVFSLPFLPLPRSATRDFEAVFYIIWVLLFSSILLPGRITMYLAEFSLLIQLNYLRTAPPVEAVPSAVPLSITVGTALIISISIWIRRGNCSTRDIEHLLRASYEAVVSLNENPASGILTLF